MKKLLTCLALAGILVAGGASAANAAAYPVDPVITTNDSSPVPGQSVTLSVQVPAGITAVTFTINGAPAGSTLASTVFAAANTVDLSVTKPVVNGTASAVFTPGGPGTFTVTASAPGMADQTLSLVVAAATDQPGDDSDDLATTGSDIPVGVIWAGVGAIALGGVAVAAAAARRRSHSDNN